MRSETRHRMLRPAPPDIAPFAGLFLIVSCFFLLTSTFKELPEGLVSLDETPRTLCNVCFNVPDHTQIHVCLTVNGRVSFLASELRLQQAALEQVGKKSGGHVSIGLPFTSYKAFGSLALTEAQLLGCIYTARALSPVLINQPAAIYLSINAQTKASLVMHLFKQLQRRKFNRLYLITHC